jgi:hypothetical protein
MHMRVLVHSKREVITQRQCRVYLTHNIRGEVQTVNNPAREKEPYADATSWRIVNYLPVRKGGVGWTIHTGQLS